MTPDDLTEVQETLLVPLWARALESRKRRPLVEDRVASELMDRLPYNFKKIPADAMTQIAVAVRTLYIDHFITKFLSLHPGGQVIELGVGLSTCFDRLDNGEVIWWEGDLAEPLALRQKYLASSSRRRRQLTCDICDPSWSQDIPKDVPTLVLVEGVLMYLTADQVEGFARQLGRDFPHLHLVFDSLSEYGLGRRRLQQSIRNMDATFKWALTHDELLAKWIPGLELQAAHGICRPPEELVSTLPLFYRFLMTTLRTVRPQLADSYRIQHYKRGLD